MSTTTRSFNPMTDRYAFDFRRCTYEQGWAQLDTSQDASYYGQWINPKTRTIVCYAEGDIYTTVYDSDAEMVEAVRKIREWNLEQGHRFLGIDPGFNPAFKEQFVEIGLGEYLH